MTACLSLNALTFGQIDKTSSEIEFEALMQEAARVLGRTLEKWKEELIGYFGNRWTNGFTEATNGTAKALQRRARGFRNFGNYRLKTLNACFY